MPAAAVAVAAAVAFAVTRPDPATPPDSGAGPTTSPAVSATTSAPPDLVPADLRPWPTAAGACGNEAYLPLLAVRPLRVRTGLTVLLGGAGLRLVDVDTGATRPVVPPGGAGGGQVVELAGPTEGPAAAVRVTCRDMMSPAGTVLTIDPTGLTVETAVARRVDALVAGPDAAWAFRYPTEPSGRRIVLRPVDGGDPMRLPAGFDVTAATRQDFVGSVVRVGTAPADGETEVAAVSREDPAALRRLGRGYVMAAAGGTVLTGRCQPNETCELSWIEAGDSRAFPLPAGRFITSRVVLDEDGRYAAFQLARPAPDPRFDPGHPGGPSDLAVLDLRTRRLSVVPGIELAPKASVGVAFSRDGRWLLIALNEGRRARLLVWRPGMDRPMVSPARLPGRVLYTVPVLDVTGR